MSGFVPNSRQLALDFDEFYKFSRLTARGHKEPLQYKCQYSAAIKRQNFELHVSIHHSPNAQVMLLMASMMKDIA